MTLLELLQLLKKHLKLVIALPIVCAVAVAAYAWLFMPNTYTASVSMYVLASSEDSASKTTMQSDLSASQMLTNDVAQLIMSERITAETASALGMTTSELAKYKVNVTSSTTTRLVTIDVTGKGPSTTASVANGIASATSTTAKEIMAVEAVNVIDQAVTPGSPSGPNRPMYAAVAFLAGLFVVIAIVVVMDMVNTRIRKPEEIEELLGLPVIGRIPIIK